MFVCLRVFTKSEGGAQLIGGILQLLEEWEYHFSLGGMANQSMKAMRAKNIDGPSRDTSNTIRDAGEDVDKQHEQVRPPRY